MYAIGRNERTVFAYTLTTAWDISTASFDLPTEGYFSVAAQETNPTGLFFKPDGSKMYVTGSADNVSEYDISLAWDISTASFVQNFSVSAQETQPQGLFFKPDGTKMYLVGYSGGDVNEYDLSTAWDISTASYVQNFSVSTQDAAMNGVFFKSDGSKFYLSGTASDSIYSYSLTSPWDISTASYVHNFSVYSQDSQPSDLFFKPDGTKMYVSGTVNDSVNEYSLTTAWDISTASYVQSFSVAAQETAPNALFLGDNGTKMYVIGQDSSSVWQYTTGTYGDATLTYPASVKFPSGTAPAAPADGETDILEFSTTDGGTTWYGVRTGDAMA
jgi:6-phosphogluconolactonase (cycloisomerase 2 family)